jgi:serine/threonine protein kinase
MYPNLPLFQNATMTSSGPYDKSRDLCRFVESYEIDKTLLRTPDNIVSVGHSKLTKNMKVIVKCVNTTEYQKLKEVQILKKLRNTSGVINYLDHFYFSPTKIVMVTEFFGDYNLARFLRMFAPISENTAHKIMKQLVEVSETCYNLNILHRKIKPSNILIDVKTLKIKFHNFNTACMFTPDDQLKNYLCEATAPPEYFNSHSYTANGLYVWSLGLILYEMLFGKKAFNSRQEIMSTPCRAATDKPVDINAVVLLAWMLNKIPSQRVHLNQLKNHPWLSQRW